MVFVNFLCVRFDKNTGQKQVRKPSAARDVTEPGAEWGREPSLHLFVLCNSVQAPARGWALPRPCLGLYPIKPHCDAHQKTSPESLRTYHQVDNEG